MSALVVPAGRPSAEDILAIQSPFAATMLESLPVDNPRTFQHMFPNASPEATDLVGGLAARASNRAKRIHTKHYLLPLTSCATSNADLGVFTDTHR